MGKSFTLNFLQTNPSIDFDAKCIWQPANSIFAILGCDDDEKKVKTASFCGNKAADDYRSE